MHQKRFSPPLFTLFLVIALTVIVISAVSAGEGGVPTVNGLFYGDGDVDRYVYLAESPGRAKLYYYLDDSNEFFVAGVIDRAVNDNVFGDTSDPTDQLYVQSAGWDGDFDEHNFEALYLSDSMTFRLICEGGGYSNQFRQGFLYDADGDGDPNEADWLSSPADPGQNSPLALLTASSMMWNMNNFAGGGSPSWDVTLTTQGDPPRTTMLTYKSPGDGADDDSVLDEIGYPASGPITYDTANGWEWPLVYEWNGLLDVCNGSAISVQIVTAHNSPSKDGESEIIVDATDYGDLPDSYGTTAGNNGANHLVQIRAPYLGALVEGENDGVPGPDADGDDLAALDDEDGLTFNTEDTDWTMGSGELDATIAEGDGCLDVWVDFGDDAGNLVANGDGDFEDSVDGVDEWVIQNNAVSSADPQPVNFVFNLPVGIEAASMLALRARLSPRDDAGGCSGAAYAGGAPSPTGDATGGEVEDYQVDLSEPTSAGLSDFGGAVSGAPIWALLAGGLAVLFVVVVLAGRKAAR